MTDFNVSPPRSGEEMNAPSPPNLSELIRTRQRHPVRLVRALDLVWVAVVTGCTGGSDAPSSDESGQSSVDTPTLEIPPVADPLDVSAFVADPCALLDDTQREQLGLPVALGPEQTSIDCSMWTVDVGVADDATVVVVDVQAKTGADGPECDRADRAASMALATLR